ncbi:MAG: hypothetical protein P8X74_22270 [Reinekea sp.]
MSLNLPADEQGRIVPNTYIVLADAGSSFSDIKTSIEKQLGSGLTDEDWQLIDAQLKLVFSRDHAPATLSF